MNPRRFSPASDAARLLTIISLRLGIGPALLAPPDPRLILHDPTARASCSLQSSARTSLSVTPSRRIRRRMAESSSSSSRDGSVRRGLHMISSDRNNRRSFRCRRTWPESMGTKQAKGTNSVVCCASVAPFRCRHKKPGWCDVNCEGAGLSLAVLAPLADIPQRKSLNSSEKVIGGSSSVNRWSESGCAICHRVRSGRASGIGLPYLRPIACSTVNGMMRRNLACHRHHPDQGRGQPEG